MGGFFGIISEKPCRNSLFYGTDYHSHLGTRRAGMATLMDNGQFARSIHRLENNYFRTKFEDDLDKFKGNSGIGVISDTDPQPIVFRSHLGSFALVTVAKINNLDELTKELLDKGINFSELSSGAINPTEVVGNLITLGQTFEEGLRIVQDKIQGSCSLLLLTQEGLIAARDKFGRTPIAIGKRSPKPFTPANDLDNDAVGASIGEQRVDELEIPAYAFASETCSFPNLGFETIGFVGPGEVVIATLDGVRQLVPPQKKLHICSFLWIYYGFPTSCYEGINVEEVRFRNGVAVGRKDPVEVDGVCSIPDSGTGMAMGYAVGKKVPYRQAVAKYTPTWPRSFMPANQEQRNLVARMKLLPNSEVLKDIRLACCDDSIVRGTQLKNNVDVFYASGAKEIHIRISCPPLVYGCKYLNFSASRTELELITRRYIARQKNTDLTLFTDSSTKEYKDMVAYICKEMNFTSLIFNNIDDLIRSIGLPKECICTYCFDGAECTE